MQDESSLTCPECGAHRFHIESKRNNEYRLRCLVCGFESSPPEHEKLLAIPQGGSIRTSEELNYSVGIWFSAHKSP